MISLFCKVTKFVYLVPFSFFLLVNCSNTYKSIQIEMSGNILLQCNNPKVQKLGPGNGGFRFDCPNKNNVYFIYDTSDKKDNTIKDITINTDFPNASSQFTLLLPAIHSSLRGKEDCPSAKALNRQTGEQPLPESLWGKPKTGKHTIELAKPCGQLSVQLN